VSESWVGRRKGAEVELLEETKEVKIVCVGGEGGD